ncbi:carbonic anhydrase [Mycena belliarum]|uniref:Carbonic anhydrase n=1 Tax=Mycena belliarum TaxID=1033014 RepID=A0AAD6UAY0_9AGAR|nr:carbonic anhydrase [Mycena belliae]
MSAHNHHPTARFLNLNAAWAHSVQNSEPTFFPETTKGQAPQVLWIGCSDSRVPESVITAVRPGEIFVHRNIANQFQLDDNSAQAVLTYALDHVGVEHVVIVGHTDCGGAAACFGAARSPGFCASADTCVIDPSIAPDASLNQWLTPLTKRVAALKLSSVPKADAMPLIVEENVKMQVDNLCKAQTLLDAWAYKSKKGKDVWVHGWVYDLGTGKLRDLGISRGPPTGPPT